MTVRVPSQNEARIAVLVDILRQMQRGRSNAHGGVTLATSVTTTTVTDDNCQAASHVSLTPATAHAAALQRGNDTYVIPATGSFVIHHASTTNTDCTFSYAIVG